MLQSVWTPAFRPVLGSVWDAAKGRGGSPEPSLSELVREHFGSSLAGMYDFTSPEGLYQDAEGTTPVTAYDQPIGLALDRRFGLKRGPEATTNGNFDTDSGWTKSGPGVTWADGHYTVADIGGTDSFIAQQLTGVRAGSTLLVTLDVASNTASSAGARLRQGNNAGSATYGDTLSFGHPPGSTGILSFVITAGGDDPWITLLTSSTDTHVEYNNISVRELPGHHLTQSTTPARPRFTAQGALHDGVDDLLQAALEDDWTFLHDGSGGTLGVSMRVEPTGAAANKMSGTRTGSGAGARVGYSSPSGAGGTGGADVYNGDTVFSSYGPAPAGPFYAFVSTLDATRLETYIDGAPLAGADVEDLSSSPPQYPLRTITTASGRATDVRRIIAIREAVTDPADIALIDAWLREGA